ncbi:hypothetical protein WIW50_15330 [Flavobacteriaceae bacterium 3-367]|uniref:hypothetical protein n=1 Tax=Eudoraea algarum TaxID=3417568 RepID=UPI003270BA13
MAVALLRYRKYYYTPLKYLPILFAYTFFNELLGFLLLNNEEFSLFANDRYSFYNMVIYNIYSIFFYLYFLYLYWCYIENAKAKAFIRYSGIFFLLVALINPFFQDFMIRSQLYSYLVGGFLLIICSVLYLIQLRDPGRTFSLSRDLLFWLSLGLLIFYLGYLPIKIIKNSSIINDMGVAIMARRIHLSLILIMYSCFIIGFLRMRRRLSQ